MWPTGFWLSIYFYWPPQELVEWSVEEGADYMIGETFINFKEAMVALEAIKQYGKGKSLNDIFYYFHKRFKLIKIMNQK